MPPLWRLPIVRDAQQGRQFHAFLALFSHKATAIYRWQTDRHMVTVARNLCCGKRSQNLMIWWSRLASGQNPHMRIIHINRRQISGNKAAEDWTYSTQCRHSMFTLALYLWARFHRHSSPRCSSNNSLFFSGIQAIIIHVYRTIFVFNFTIY